MEIAFVDKHAVIDLFVRLPLLKLEIWVEFDARPPGSIQLGGAQEYITVDHGRNEFVSCAGAPGIGQDMAVNAIGFGSNVRTRGVVKPAVFIPMLILPRLDLVQLPGPINIGVI